MADKLSMAILYIREEGIRARLVNKDMAPWYKQQQQLFKQQKYDHPHLSSL
uniref:Uncharacterized protein n=1 Tax=Oryza sativa subsp. japonica TaxID=39947 RepID=Q2QT39_ORYSJ|nr:hypothetical protein LOC_Os12g21960 [Oryza sativa Japonica Group]